MKKPGSGRGAICCAFGCQPDKHGSLKPVSGSAIRVSRDREQTNHAYPIDVESEIRVTRLGVPERIGADNHPGLAPGVRAE